MPRYDLVCPICKVESLNVVHSIKEDHPPCSTCGLPLETLWRTYTPMVASDDIPGGLDIHNGICNPDGTPRKYYSKSEIKKAAYEAGWAISGDTPKLNPRLQEQRAIEREQRAR